MTIRNTKLLLLPLSWLLLPGQDLQASGWVKEHQQYYVKVAQSLNETKEYLPAALPIQEEEQATSIYAEYGLPTPWKSQVIFYTAHKEILREEVTLDLDGYKASSLTDSQLSWKSQLVNLNDYFESPVSVVVAGTIGLNIATTPSKFAIGNEEQRLNDVPQNKGYLLTTVDKGSQGIIAGLGASAFYSGVWFNLGYDLTNDQEDNWRDEKVSAAIGVGLPYNSWVQLSYSNLKSSIDADILASNQIEQLKDETTQYGIGLGATVWRGLALEAGWTQNTNEKDIWSDWQTYTFGVSYRTI